MLNKDHALFAIDFKKGIVVPDRIRQKTHQGYLELADQLLDCFKNSIGKTRRDLEREVERILDSDPACPLRRYQAFFKLLEEVSEWDTDKGHKAWQLRRTVAELAAPFHPLKRVSDGIWGHEESTVKAEIAEKLKRPWSDIEASLFTDMRQFHKLLKFDGYANAAVLLNRYNVAQCQAALYSCTTLKVEAKDDFVRILRYAKLARLLHRITRLSDGHFMFEFSGQASVLRDTERYGIAMAKFLSSLLRCKGWRMEADLRVGKNKQRVKFFLSPEDKLKPSWDEEESYDSSVEEKFAERWGQPPRNGWSLERESEILWKEQHTFCPDFVFVHEDGRRVMMEICGFWTPEYVANKRASLTAFRESKILLAVPADLAKEYTDLGVMIVTYKGSLLLPPILEALSP
jgi:predicted nuclease of restriction endonuclease-like RecB superfamily